jgi:thiol-disulfide isomerase/thioredoxin
MQHKAMKLAAALLVAISVVLGSCSKPADEAKAPQPAGPATKAANAPGPEATAAKAKEPKAREPEAPAADASAVIGHGEEVDLAEHAVKGKTTVFDFYSEFCPPCRALSPRLEELDAKRDDVVVVKVDINRPGTQGIDWDSPVVHQFGLNSVPHLVVYGPDGAEQAKGDEARQMVEEWMQ